MIKKFCPILFLFFAIQVYGNHPVTFKQTALLQTDRSCYVAGDLILLKFVQIQSDVNSALKDSVLYVDIIDSDSQFIAGEIFKLERGIASGFLKIPDATKTGCFLIRAYTYQSRNSIGQKILDRKRVFVTNRFNSTIENNESDSGLNRMTSDSIYLQEELSENYIMHLNDTLYKKRSKVTGFIKCAHKSFNDTAWLALSVKPLTDCEFQMAGKDEQVLEKESVNSYLVQKGYTVFDNSGTQVSGYVTDKITGKPLSNFLVKMAFEDSLMEIKYCNTNATGEFEFLLADSYGMQKIYLSVNSFPKLLPYPQAKIILKKDYVVCENKGMIISGHVRDQATGSPLSNVLILMAFEDSIMRLKYSVSDEKGEFMFLLNNSYDEEDVYLSTYSYPELLPYPQTKITLQSKFLENTKTTAGIKNNIGNEQSIDSLNVLKSIISIAYDISLIHEKAHAKPKNMSFNLNALLGNNSHTVYLDNYIDLPDLIQITKEILPFAQLEKTNGAYSLSVIGENYKIRKNPIIFVDGIPISDIEAIIGWGSNKIKMIQIQCEPRYFGDVPFENGMVFIWTREMDFWSKTECKTTSVFTIPCFQKPISINFPNYSIENNINRPDFRQILYWEPSITIKNNETLNFEFYTSDEAGIFELLLQGVTKSNKPVIIRKFIQVK